MLGIPPTEGVRDELERMSSGLEDSLFARENVNQVVRIAKRIQRASSREGTWMGGRCESRKDLALLVWERGGRNSSRNLGALFFPQWCFARTGERLLETLQGWQGHVSLPLCLAVFWRAPTIPQEGGQEGGIGQILLTECVCVRSFASIFFAIAVAITLSTHVMFLPPQKEVYSQCEPIYTSFGCSGLEFFPPPDIGGQQEASWAALVRNRSRGSRTSLIASSLRQCALAAHPVPMCPP